MKLIIAIAIIAVAISAITAQADRKNKTADEHPGTYLIVAPRTIRPGLPYSVSVNILQTKEPVAVVELEILDNQNKSVAKATGRYFKAGVAQTVSFDQLPNTLAPESQYRLRAKGQLGTSGKIMFEKEQTLNVESKSRSVFIQTDKGIYKPGAVVHFRAMVVTPDLKPFKGTVDIKISDPNENLIKQYLNQTLDGGVVGKNDALKLQLSEEPPLGTWKISVDVEGQKTDKTFTVDKYVLPKFEVSLQTPPYVGSNLDAFEVTVSAKYTYGKGVPGTAVVVVEVPWYYFPQQPATPEIAETDVVVAPRTYVSPKFEKKVDLNDKTGETKVKFTKDDFVEHKMFVNASTYGQYSLTFTASITEKFTNTQKNTSGYVTVYKHIERVKVEKQVDTFKPGLDYNITISVVTQDDKPLPSTSGRTITVRTHYRVPVVLTTTTSTTTTTTTAAPGDNVTTTTEASHDYDFGFWYQPTTEIETQEEMTLGADGTVVLTLVPPLNATSLSMEVYYGSNTSDVTGSVYADASKSPSDSYLQLLSKSSKVNAGDNLNFKVRTTQAVDTVTVQIVSKGYIVLSKQVKLTGHEGEIVIATTTEMAPKSRIIAYAIRPQNKEILVDAMDFHVDGLIKNNVTINVDPKKVEPNQTVTFNVKAAPKSFVGLLAVDQSVLLLSSGNDITNDLIESDIGSYDSSGGYYGFGLRRRKRMIWCRGCWWGSIGGQDATSVFENSGVIVFTDAFLYKKPEPPIPSTEEAVPIVEGAVVDDGEAPMASSAAPPPKPDEDQAIKKPGGGSAPEPAVRQNFPETWLWVDAVSK